LNVFVSLKALLTSMWERPVADRESDPERIAPKAKKSA
jgi:hypothetical protein